MDILKEYPYYSDITKIYDSLFELNARGRKEAVKRVEELTEIPRYRREDAPPEAAGDVSPGTDTPTPPKPTENT